MPRKSETLRHTDKTAGLGLRIGPVLRKALEDEATRSNRSLSHVALDWMERGRTGQAASDALGRPTAVGDALRRLAEFADELQERLGADPERDPYARSALISGWQSLLGRTMSLGRVADEQVASTRALIDVHEAAKEMLVALAALNQTQPDHVILARLQRAPTQNALNALLAGAFPDPHGGKTALAMLLELAQADASRLRGDVEKLVIALIGRLDEVFLAEEADQWEDIGLAGPRERLATAYLAWLEADIAHTKRKAEALKVAVELVAAKTGSLEPSGIELPQASPDGDGRKPASGLLTSQ